MVADILGFSRPIEEDAKNLYVSPEFLRKRWVEEVANMLDNARESGFLFKIAHITMDSWFISVLAPAYVDILIDLLHRQLIPLEVAIHFAEFDNGDYIEYSDSVMEWLRNGILLDYKKYKKTKNGSVKETFVLATEKAYDALGSGEEWEKPYPAANYYHLVNSIVKHGRN